MSNKDEHQSIEDLLKKQQKMIASLQKSHAVLEKRLKTMVIFGYIKLAIVVIPIVLGIIYIPPIIKDMERVVTQINTLPFDSYNQLNLLDIFEFIQGTDFNQ